MTRQLLTIFLIAGLCAPVAAQNHSPVPPPPVPREPWTVLPDPLTDHSLPAIETPAEWAAKAAEQMGQPEIALGADAISWVGSIHDERKAAANEARARANDAMKRDLYRAGIKDLTFDDCVYNPTQCMDAYRLFSPETKKAIEDYGHAQDRYIAWTDIGNNTGRGWTPEEVAGVVANMAKSGAGKVLDFIKERVDEHSGESLGKDIATDAAADEASKRLEQFDKSLEERRAAGGSADASGSIDVPVSDTELRAAREAAAQEGQSIDAGNAHASPMRSDKAYADTFAADAAKERQRLDEDVASVERSFDQASQRSASYSERLNREASAFLNQLLNLAPPPLRSSPMVAPTTSGGFPKPASTPSDKDPVNHCPNGVFICPNGNPWEKCTHPEKWQCPPPGVGPRTPLANQPPTSVPTKKTSS